MRWRARSVPLVVLVVGLLLASCGDERLTAAEFVAKGNQVCTRADRRLAAVFRTLSGPEQPTAEEVQGAIEKVVPITQDVVDDFKQLHPPERLEKRFEVAISHAENAIVELRNAAATPEGAQRLFTAGPEEDPFKETNESLKAIGITRCSDDAEAGAGAGAPGGSGLGELGGGGQTGGTGPAGDGHAGHDHEGGADAEAAAGATKLRFEAGEYRYSGPAKAKAGKVAVILSNIGEESHEMAIVRLKEGVTANEVLSAEAAGKDPSALIADDAVGGVPPVAPDATGVANLELTPGTYSYACFIDAPDGEPHAKKGMFGELTVT